MKELLKNIKDSKNGNAIFFFAFYLLFFIVVFLLIRFGGNKNHLTQEYEHGNNGFFDNEKLLKNNYYFEYKITNDDVVYKYSGKRNGKNELFKFNDVEYYKNNNSYFVKKDDSWEKTTNPYKYYEFINIEKSGNLLDVSYFLSTKEVDDKVVEYTFSVSTNSINKLLYDTDSDFDEIPNQIIIGVDEKKNVNKIIFKLDSFCKLKNLCNNKLEIELNYEMFGEIKKIDNPVA